MKKLEKKQLIVVAFTFALLLLIGGTYAYFSINATSDKTGAKVTGKANSLGNPTMQIKTSKLYLNLDANLMSQANAGKTYYANENESGLALETNPNYTLATAQLPEGDEALDCTYNYKVTTTVTTPITDNSDSDVKVIVGEKEMTLKELTTAGTDGIIVRGAIINLTKGNSVSISLTSTVYNSYSKRDDLVGNSYTINIEPYNEGVTKAFSCQIHEPGPVLAQYLINSGNLWQSGLEGDGYRYVGSEDEDKFTNPNNFICFGTSDLSTCTSDPEKYMYRIIGVFPDSDGNSHVKLIKMVEISDDVIWFRENGNYKYDGTNGAEVWADSYIYEYLNGKRFLNCTSKDPRQCYYDYLQDNLWRDRIENWTWSAVNTNIRAGYGRTIEYNNMTSEQIYTHEMNRTNNTINYGSWTTPSAKIGLPYVSDYALSLGVDSLTLTSSSSSDILKTGWMLGKKIEINGTNYNGYYYTLASAGELKLGSYFINRAWGIGSDGSIDNGSDVEIQMLNTRPTFYLTSDVKVTTLGDGSYTNPFIIED